MGHLHNDIIYYYDQNPSGFCFLVQITAFVINLAGITKFNYEKKNEKDSGHSSKMTPSCKWPIIEIAMLLSKTTTEQEQLQALVEIYRCVFIANFPSSFKLIPASFRPPPPPPDSVFPHLKTQIASDRECALSSVSSNK